MTHKTFVATIFETDQIFQDVICYLDNWYDDGSADVRIGLPLYVKPVAIEYDVDFWLNDAYGLNLNKLTYELAPQNVMIHI